MLTRTWSYGATRRVQVVEHARTRKSDVLAVVDLDGEREGFVLVRGPGGFGEKVPVGQRGTITFRRGGPTGGYWDYKPEGGTPDAGAATQGR